MLHLAIVLTALLAAGPALACPGDCDGDGAVRVNELVTAVGIALGQGGACRAADGNGDGQVTIAELVAATNALLSGCPAATPTPPPTPTPTVNLPPELSAPFVYRGVVGEAIARPLGATDPEGGPVTCAADALLAGMALDPDHVLRWTPAEAQAGLVDVPVRCQDAGQPPLAAAAALAFRISPRDPCATPVCDAAAGCTATIPAVGEPCCTGAEIARFPEAEVLCPSGRLLQVGRNADGFGALQNCDHLRFRQSAQTSAEVRLHVRVSCLNALNRIAVTARLESAIRGTVVNAEARGLFAPSSPAGFAERRNLEFPFAIDGPFLGLEETEANLIVTARDSNGTTVSQTLRVILTSSSLLPDLPDP